MIDEDFFKRTCDLIRFGFTCDNDPLGKFIFVMDDITIIYRSNSWIINDPENGPVDYLNLREILINEFWRWEE